MEAVSLASHRGFFCFSQPFHSSFEAFFDFTAKDNFFLLTARVSGGDLLFPWRKRGKNAPGADSPYQGEMSRRDRGDRDRCPQRGRMRGTALIMQAVRFPRAAEGGGPYRWGHLMPRRAAARAAPTQAKDRFQLTCRGGACPSRSVFRRRGGPVCPPGCTGPLIIRAHT